LFVAAPSGWLFLQAKNLVPPFPLIRFNQGVSFDKGLVLRTAMWVIPPFSFDRKRGFPLCPDSNTCSRSSGASWIGKLFFFPRTFFFRVEPFPSPSGLDTFSSPRRTFEAGGEQPFDHPPFSFQPFQWGFRSLVKLYALPLAPGRLSFRLKGFFFALKRHLPDAPAFFFGAGHPFFFPPWAVGFFFWSHHAFCFVSNCVEPSLCFRGPLLFFFSAPPPLLVLVFSPLASNCKRSVCLSTGSSLFFCCPQGCGFSPRSCSLIEGARHLPPLSPWGPARGVLIP